MANLDDFKDAWQSQEGVAQDRFDEMSAKVQEDSTRLRSTVFRRDLVETLASLLVIAFFAPGLFVAPNWVAWSGFLVVVLAGITIPLVLWWARKRSIPSVATASYCDLLDMEVDYLSRQVALLRRVAWWYLLPIYVGIFLIVVALSDPISSTPFDQIFIVLYLSGCAVLFVYIWWLNRQACKNHLEPLLTYYTKMREAIASGADWDRQLAEPPNTFLHPQPRKPMSRRRRWIWTVSISIASGLAAGGGYAVMRRFDERTGIFLMSTAPVIAIFWIMISGIWRQWSPIAPRS